MTNLPTLLFVLLALFGHPHHHARCAAPQMWAAPTLTAGTPFVGATLTLTRGNWASACGATYSYTWLAQAQPSQPILTISSGAFTGLSTTWTTTRAYGGDDVWAQVTACNRRGCAVYSTPHDVILTN